MDVKKWNALLSAVRLGSFSKAAEELGYTQSGLTYMMNSLEEEIGFPLLMRSWDGVRLTAEGEALLPGIRAVVESDAALRERLAEMGGKLASHLVIGTYASISVHWLGPIVGSVRAEMPNTEIELRIGSHRELTEWLGAGSITFSLADRLEVPSAQWLPMYDDPLLAVVPKNHPAARKETFTADDLGNLPFLVPSHSAVGGTDLKLRLQRRPSLRVETEDDLVLLSMVEQGAGISILSELSIRGRVDGVAAIPLAQPAFRHLGVTIKEGADGVVVRRLLTLLRAKLPRPAGA